MRDEELQQIAARCEAATSGPWRSSHSGQLPEPVVVSVTTKSRRGGPMIVAGTRWPLASLGASEEAAEANAHFIAHARADVPRLVAEVRRLKALAEAVGHGVDTQGGWGRSHPHDSMED